MKKISQLSQDKYRYTQNVRKLKLTSLGRENDSLINRLSNAHSAVKKVLDLQDATHQSPRRCEVPKTIAHDMSNKSLLSNISDKTVGSNWRRRTIRQKEIEA